MRGPGRRGLVFAALAQCQMYDDSMKTMQSYHSGPTHHRCDYRKRARQVISDEKQRDREGEREKRDRWRGAASH